MQQQQRAHRDVGFEGGAARVSGGKHDEHQNLCATANLVIFRPMHLQQHPAGGLPWTLPCC